MRHIISKQELIEDIHAQFKDQTYPGNDNIVYDNSGDHLECNEVKDAFQSYKWRDVPFDVLIKQESGLSFMTLQAFRYYLPAYLLAVVEHFEDTDVLAENVINYLTLPTVLDSLIDRYLLAQENDAFEESLRKIAEHIDEHIHRFIERVSGFSPPQGGAIKHFLVFMNHEFGSYFFADEPAAAIYRYWFIYD